MLQVHTQSTHQNTSNDEHMEFGRMRINKKKADYQRTLMLVVVVNSIKLHLTAFKRELSIETLVIH